MDGIFTPKELNILKLSAQGHMEKVIADKLSMSHATVSLHKGNILKKARPNGYRWGRVLVDADGNVFNPDHVTPKPDGRGKRGVE